MRLSVRYVTHRLVGYVGGVGVSVANGLGAVLVIFRLLLDGAIVRYDRDLRGDVTLLVGYVRRRVDVRVLVYLGINCCAVRRY